MTTLLHNILDEKATITPKQTFIRKRDTCFTYEQIRSLSLIYARWMISMGIRRGDRIVIAAPHEIETVAAIFAISRIGAMYVIINDQTPLQPLKELIEDCEPSLILFHNEPFIIPSGVSVQSVSFAGISDTPEMQLPDDHPCISIDPVSLIYTSGSTSTPKAIISTHHQILFAAGAILSQLKYRPEDTIFCCLPLFFDYGLYQIYLTCLAGAELVLGDAIDAGPLLLNQLNRYKITVFPLMPSLATTLISLVLRSGKPPSQLRMVTNTGAAISPQMADQLRALIPGLDVMLMFGLTECKRVSIMHANGDLQKPQSVGRPLPDTEVFIVDQDGKRLPPGENGELVVRGQHVMVGYWRAPELTAKRFRRDEFGQPLLYTGDFCRLDEDGYLYFVGREDDIYKERGYRVSSIEVEMAALSIPKVELAALLKPTEDHGSLLIVSGTISPTDVLKALSSRLVDYKVPSECKVLDVLPLNANGKLDKKALKKMFNR